MCEKRADQVGQQCQTDSLGCYLQGPSVRVCLSRLPMNLGNTPSGKGECPSCPAVTVAPSSPPTAAVTTLGYHRNLTAAATSYLSTAVQRHIASLDF